MSRDDCSSVPAEVLHSIERKRIRSFGMESVTFESLASVDRAEERCELYVSWKGHAALASAPATDLAMRFARYHARSLAILCHAPVDGAQRKP